MHVDVRFNMHSGNTEIIATFSLYHFVIRFTEVQFQVLPFTC